MINAEFLASCTDEQIERGVEWIECKKLNLCEYYTFSDYELGYFNTPNYCTNPSDIMPIAFSNNFLIEPPNFFTNKWKVTKYYIIENIGERSINATNTNPLRAICEVYILMSVNK